MRLGAVKGVILCHKLTLWGLRDLSPVLRMRCGAERTRDVQMTFQRLARSTKPLLIVVHGLAYHELFCSGRDKYLSRRKEIFYLYGDPHHQEVSGGVLRERGVIESVSMPETVEIVRDTYFKRMLLVSMASLRGSRSDTEYWKEGRPRMLCMCEITT